MKTLILFINLFVLQFAAQSQEYIGLKFRSLSRLESPDKRYDINDWYFTDTGIDSIQTRFYKAFPNDSINYGTSIFFNPDKGSIVNTQLFYYYVKQTEYVHQELIRLYLKGYKVKYTKIDDDICTLEIKR